MKILVLGHTGMLGHMVHKYLSTKDNCELVTTKFRWEDREFKKFILDFDGDFVVNCIGAIHQRTNEFGVNIELPKWLDKIEHRSKRFKIIHPGTDCEIDDDDYGNSKREAAEYLLEKGKDTTIIKTSILGPELNTKASLLEWFLNVKEDTIEGYSEYYWNGNTTLQWAKICYRIMCDYWRYDTLNIPTSNCISKYELLKIIKEVFKKEINIKKNPDIKFKKCLETTYDMPHTDIETQIRELKEFYYEDNIQTMG
jgi:dTDP-4-dehydrorhamnose reductase